MEMWWQRWVVDYNLEHQLYLASRFEQSTRKWNRFSPEEWLSGIGRGVETAVSAAGNRDGSLRRVRFAYYRSRRGSSVRRLVEAARRLYHSRRIRQGGAGASDAAILYFQMLALLRKRGFEKPGWLTPAEFARVLPASQTATLVKEFTELYQDLRYGNRPAAGEQMLGLLRQIEASGR